MKFTREDLQIMARHGWDLQPDGENFRNRSATNVAWIAKNFDHSYYAFEAVTVGDSQYEEKALTPDFDNPVVVVVFMEIERSNN